MVCRVLLCGEPGNLLNFKASHSMTFTDSCRILAPASVRKCSVHAGLELAVRCVNFLLVSGARLSVSPCSGSHAGVARDPLANRVLKP